MPTQVHTATLTTYASFSGDDYAEKAAGALLDHGVRIEDISLVSLFERDLGSAGTVAIKPSHKVSRPFVTRSDFANGLDPGINIEHTVIDPDGMIDSERLHEPTLAENRLEPEVTAKSGITTTTPEDAVSGAERGAEVGFGVGALAALASLMIPGIGFVVGGGALAIALAGTLGATAAGAVAGGALGYMKDQGVPGDAVERYCLDYYNGGAILAVAVSSDDIDAITVEEILRKYHGNHIGTYAQ